MKIRVVLSSEDRKRFVCWWLGHRWAPDPGATVDPNRPRFVCRRCAAMGEGDGPL